MCHDGDLKLVVEIDVIFKLKPLTFNTHVIRHLLFFVNQSTVGQHHGCM